MDTVITVGNKSYPVTGIQIGDICEIAKTKSNLLERQLTQFLGVILGNAVLAANLTCQERYALLLHYYVELPYSDLDQSINPLDYTAPLVKFEQQRISNDDDSVSIRYLTGIEAEAIELGSSNRADWMLAEMAMIISYGDKLPKIDYTKDMKMDVRFTANIVQTRLNALQSLEQYEFNDLMLIYSELKQKRPCLVKSEFDDQGIVLHNINGGTDDAPVRFRARSAITGAAKELFTIYQTGV